MGARTYKKRIEETKAKRTRAMKRVGQYNEETKQLEKKDAEEERKYRTHMLIVCGAELAALFQRSFLEKDEIHAVVNFLREQQNAGNFTLEKQKTEVTEEPRVPLEKTQSNEEEPFGGLFNF